MKVAITLGILAFPVIFACDELWVLGNGTTFNPDFGSPKIIIDKPVDLQVLHMKCAKIMSFSNGANLVNASPRAMSRWISDDEHKGENIA